MRAEYLSTHARLRSTITKGTTSAILAGLDTNQLDHVFDLIMNELVREMAQHQLHPRMIEAPIRQRCEELKRQHHQGQTLGGSTTASGDGLSARERALAAAERRAREQHEKEER